MNDALRYVYAVADARAIDSVARAGRGIDGALVEPVVEGALLAATSVVPASEYEEGPLNEHLQHLDWLAPRAEAHQAVNAKLLDLTRSVVPLAFGAIYRGADGVRAMLRARAADLTERLRRLEGRAEWIVSIERDASGGVESEALRALEREIASAPQGRAFLLAKRRAEVVREERRARDAALVDQTSASFEQVSEDIYREPLIDDPSAVAIARWSVLARLNERDRLGEVAASLNASPAGRGCVVRLSGPWPAYRFGGLPAARVEPA